MTNTQVQRWTGHVSAFEGGGFVAYGDYLTLERELQAAQADIERLNDKVERLMAVQPVQVEHCLWARNGNQPCPHTQPSPAPDTWTDDGGWEFPIMQPSRSGELTDAEIDRVAHNAGIHAEPRFGFVSNGNVQMRHFAKAIIAAINAKGQP